MTNHIRSIPGRSADSPPPRGSECEGDVLLPLMGAPIEPVDADDTGTPHCSLPRDDNGDAFLPLLGDEDEALDNGNTDINLLTKE